MSEVTTANRIQTLIDNSRSLSFEDACLLIGAEPTPELREEAKKASASKIEMLEMFEDLFKGFGDKATR